jgi:hypothetical protein
LAAESADIVLNPFKRHASSHDDHHHVEEKPPAHKTHTELQLGHRDRQPSLAPSFAVLPLAVTVNVAELASPPSSSSSTSSLPTATAHHSDTETPIQQKTKTFPIVGARQRLKDFSGSIGRTLSRKKKKKEGPPQPAAKEPASTIVSVETSSTTTTLGLMPRSSHAKHRKAMPAAHGYTRRAVEDAKIRQGEWMVDKDARWKECQADILKRCDRMRGTRGVGLD